MEKIPHLPLSSNQERLWIIAQQDRRNPGYNIQLAYHLEGEINISILKESIKQLFERQHTLFSVFIKKDGVPYITIIPRIVEIEFIDYSHLESAYEKILAFAGDDSRIPFDIENGPLYRIFLLKEAAGSYFFCLTIHHIIFDGFSRRLFVEELNLTYNNLVKDINGNIEPLKYHSYDFSAKEKNDMPDSKEKEYIEFWKETLKDCPAELKLPLDFKRKTDPSGIGRRESFRLTQAATEKVRALSRESETTVFKTLLSILGVFLNKCTGSKDVCIGIPVSKRKSDLSSKVFGFFVNTVPVRVPINESGSFKEHIVYSSDVTKKAIQNSALPFDKIVSAVNPERIHGLTPFFQVAFSWINNFTQPLDLGGVKGKRITVPEGVSSFDLSFYMWENDDIIEGYIEYNSDLFKQQTIKGILDNFLILVNILSEYPDKALRTVSMISVKEMELIESFNNTYTDYPGELTINQLFEEQVILCRDRKAVIYNDTSVTYNELNEKSNQLAVFLRSSGVNAGENVGLMIDKSVDMIVGIMGILKAGGAYVPIDPEYPAQRKNFILSDSGCRILVTQDKYLANFETEIRKVSIESSLLSEYGTSDFERINTSSDVAYLIYTSGTTGNPKGTLIPHKGVVRMVRNSNCIDVRPEDNVAQIQSVVFDASTVEIFGALLNGASLIVIDKTTLLDPAEMDGVFTKNNITVAAFSSTLFAQLTDLNSGIFRNLRYIQVGGDVLSAPHVNKIRQINRGLRFVNVYGPTENSCISTYYDIDKECENNVPIGKPISNSTAYIFDNNMNYQPVGIIGELYVGGEGLSKGYLNRNDLNQTSFIDHPYYPGKRLYKTGDLARWLPDGNIEFHGRIDTQVKIRGYRIELREIESVLAEMEGISEAVVKPVVVSTNDTRLVAFLKATGDAGIDFNQIRDHLRSRMPSYMVPSAFRTVSAFPMTINGKIDLKALSIDLSRAIVEEKKVSKELTPTQQKIAKIWQELIHTNNISLNDNFFDIGGTSLIAIRAVDRIEKEFKIKLSARVFFDCPRINCMAEHIESKISHERQSSYEFMQKKSGRIISREF